MSTITNENTTVENDTENPDVVEAEIPTNPDVVEAEDTKPAREAAKYRRALREVRGRGERPQAQEEAVRGMEQLT